MKIHYLQHVSYEGPGSIAPWADNNGHDLSCTRLYSREDLPAASQFDWLIIMGGPMSINNTEQYPWLKEEKDFIKTSISAGKTVLGICLGAQLIADALGATVTANSNKEIGWFPVTKTPVLAGSKYSYLIPEEIEVFHWHGDTFSLPAGAIPVAHSRACKNQGFLYGDRIIALQFHLETTVDSVQSLINNCANEITKGPYIQNADTMLADKSKYMTINKFMDRVLDYLASITG